MAHSIHALHAKSATIYKRISTCVLLVHRLAKAANPQRCVPHVQVDSYSWMEVASLHARSTNIIRTGWIARRVTPAVWNALEAITSIAFRVTTAHSSPKQEHAMYAMDPAFTAQDQRWRIVLTLRLVQPVKHFSMANALLAIHPVDNVLAQHMTPAQLAFLQIILFFSTYAKQRNPL